MVERNLLDALKYSTLRFWHAGRIIDTLHNRKEEGVIEEISEQTKFERRAILYWEAAFRAFPNFGEVYKLCDKGTQWSHFKELLRLADVEQRKTLVSRVLSNKLSPKALKTEVDKILDKGGGGAGSGGKDKSGGSETGDGSGGKDSTSSKKTLAQLALRYTALSEALAEVNLDLESSLARLRNEDLTSSEELAEAVKQSKPMLKILRDLFANCGTALHQTLHCLSVSPEDSDGDPRLFLALDDGGAQA